MWSEIKALASLSATTLKLLLLGVAWHFWLISVTVTGHGSRFIILKWVILFIPFWCSSLREIICLAVSSFNHAFKALREYNAREILTTISIIIPNVLSALQSHNPQNPNQSKKDPIEGVTLLSQMVCSVILCNWVSTSLKMLIQVQQMMLATAQIPSYSAKR